MQQLKYLSVSTHAAIGLNLIGAVIAGPLGQHELALGLVQLAGTLGLVLILIHHAAGVLGSQPPRS